MKKLALLLLLATTFIARADTNILANSDFADGTAHWRGDGSSAGGPDSDNPLNSNPGSGITIQLKSSCAYISQDFSTRETSLAYTITCKLSSDYQSTGWASGAGLTDILSQLFGVRINGSIKSEPASWLVIVMDPHQAKMCYSYFTPKPSPNPQTITGTIPHLLEFAEKSFYLVLPPGQGSVSLMKVSLDPAGSTSASPLPSPNP
jgi:hypothetical protein